MTAAQWLVWLMPLVAGSGVWAVFAGWPRRPHEVLAAVGAGWILGACACGLLTGWLAADELASAPLRVGIAAAVLGSAGWLAAWCGRSDRRAGERSTRTERGVAIVVLALLGVRAWMLADDIVLHPTLPWDAWSVWQAKAKAWVLAGHFVPYVSFDEWLSASAEVRTTDAWNYPELLPWMLVWFAGAGGWIEPIVNLSWWALWIALLTQLYAQWRLLHLPRLAALAGIWAFASLPLVDAHVALGGYADLWIAAVLSLGVHAWLRWHCLGDRRQIALVVLALSVLPMLKLEGAAWAIALGGAGLLTVLPPHWRGGRLLAGAVVAAIAVLLSVALNLTWTGVALDYLSEGMELDPSQIAASLGAIAVALWGQWNWNLLWFVLPLALWWNRGDWLRDPVARRLAEFVAVSTGAVVALFVLTTASRHAQSYSAVNRLLLQMTPLLVALLVFALRSAFSGDSVRAPPSLPRSASADGQASEHA